MKYGRVELAVRDGGDGDRRKAGCGIGVRRGAGKLALGESGGEALIRGDGGIDGAVGHSGRDRRAAHCSEQTALKCLARTAD